jgi:hypothetical protein
MGVAKQLPASSFRGSSIGTTSHRGGTDYRCHHHLISVIATRVARPSEEVSHLPA